ncbi:hypothetical protein GO988_01220 [Hymenobacter sp. HMF4947]|uniref:Uncharacterized protein n=1 Tax=Hymenobacter ginkgonis TaxID=2682976 RepID=A0A7K1T961_9BACT|nr:hypothetical protein [Hymenobacter ginkgonis]MVN74938.1 hypothetical protein [Hymenobacter ginkgonis]
MTKNSVLPTYLPSIDNRLEHLAALRPVSWPAPATNGVQPSPARPWLGEDFTHVIVAR